MSVMKTHDSQAAHLLQPFMQENRRMGHLIAASRASPSRAGPTRKMGTNLVVIPKITLTA